MIELHMTKKQIVIAGFLAAIIIVGGFWMMFMEKNIPKNNANPAPYSNQNPIKPNMPADENSGQNNGDASVNDASEKNSTTTTSDDSLDKDLASIDNQLKSLDADAAGIDQGLNDQPIAQGE